MNSVAVPRFEYEVTTEDGRTMIWCAPSEKDALQRMKEKGYKPVHIELYVPYVPEQVQREIAAADEQRALDWEFKQAIEQEAKTA